MNTNVIFQQMKRASDQYEELRKLRDAVTASTDKGVTETTIQVIGVTSQSVPVHTTDLLEVLIAAMRYKKDEIAGLGDQLCG